MSGPEQNPVDREATENDSPTVPAHSDRTDLEATRQYAGEASVTGQDDATDPEATEIGSWAAFPIAGRHKEVLSFATRTLPPLLDLKQADATESLRPLSRRGAKAEVDSLHIREVKSSAVATGDNPDYLKIAQIGEGGMGVVHLARQVAFGREVAIKEIRSVHEHSSGFKDDFLTEAVVTARLEHPNIVPIYELGLSGAGRPFYSMKLIDGRVWKQCVDEVSFDENLNILIKVCDAVAYAHSRRIVHRDLKPDNVMIGEFGEVVVLDWGLASILGPSDCIEGECAGTPAYMAPESANPPGKFDLRSEVYLLGGLLYRILTGKSPHVGQSGHDCLLLAADNRLSSPDSARLEEVDPSGQIMATAQKALSTNPDDRHQSAKEFQEALQQLASDRKSYELCRRAMVAFEVAQDADDYTLFSRAFFGFEESLELSPGNTFAAEMMCKVRLAWAACAEAQGDFDLAISHLHEVPEQDFAIARITSAKHERDQRQERLQRTRKLLAATGLLGCVLLGLAAVWINAERNTAISERNSERLASKQASDLLRISESQREKAIAAEANARASEQSALTSARRNRELLYATNMRLVSEQWTNPNGSTQLVKDLMESAVPTAGESDLRDFTWWMQWNRLQNSSRRVITQDGLRAAVSASNNQIVALDWHPGILKWRQDAPKPVRHTIHEGTDDQNHWLSPVGNVIAVESGGKLKLFDLPSLSYLFTCETSARDISEVAFSENGEFVAAVVDSTPSKDRVHIWNVREGTTHKTLIIPDLAKTLRPSPDGNRVAVFRKDKGFARLNVFPKPQGIPRIVDTSKANAIAWSPDGNRIASTGGRGTFVLYDIPSQSATSIPSQSVRHDIHHGVIVNLAFSPDGKRLVTGSRRGNIGVWVVNTPNDVRLEFSLMGHTRAVESISFSPDGTQVISCSEDEIRIWNVKAPEDSTTFPAQFDPSNAVRIAVSNDLKWLVANHNSNGAKLFRFDVEAPRVALPYAGYAVAFSPDSRTLAVNDGKLVCFWDLETHQEIARWDIGDPVGALEFSGDGKLLVAAPGRRPTLFSKKTGPKAVRIWDVDSRNESHKLVGHSNTVSDVALSSNGKTLFTSSHDGTVRVWNTADWKEKKILETPESNTFLASMTVTPDGRFTMAGTTTGTIFVWENETGILVDTLRGHTHTVSSLSCSPDGRILVSSSWDRSVRFWHVATRRQIHASTAHADWVHDVEFTADGSTVVTGAKDKIRLWNGRKALKQAATSR